MRIMFVCTGNICRSPMGELLLTRYLSGTTAGFQRGHAWLAHAPD